jgi:hypothetical protein
VSSTKGRIFNNMLYVRNVQRTLDDSPSIFIRDKPTFSSDGMLRKDYYRKGSVGGKEISGRGSQRA